MSSKVQKKTSTCKKTETAMESNGFVFRFSIVGITIIAIMFSYLFQNDYSLPWSSSSSLENDAEGELLPKSQSPTLTTFHTQILLPDDDEVEFCSNIHYTGLLTHITTIMEESSVESRVSKSQVFVMLNGENEGLIFNFPNTSCLSTLATSAARDLGADTDWTQLGMSLMDQNGVPVKTPEDLESSGRIVHVLLSQQLWQWPGIKIGHIHTVSPTINLTTISLRPKVFDVQGFLSQTEADEIIAIGSETLNRSRVQGKNQSFTVSKSRTSHTAFLPDSIFTRDFRSRSTNLARLPSPTFAERLQLVRYGSGEFYRKHMDTFHSQKPFMTRVITSYVYQDYIAWITFIKTTISKIPDDELPEGYKTGQKFVPQEADNDGDKDNTAAVAFQNAMLKEFLQYANTTGVFTARNFVNWKDFFIRVAENEPTRNVMTDILKPEKKVDHVLRSFKDIWEAGVVHLHPSLRYTFPKRRNGIGQYYRWIRWAKESVASETTSSSLLEGKYYPSYSYKFQMTLANVLLKTYSSEVIAAVTTDKWADWILENKDRRDVLIKALMGYPALLNLVVRGWEGAIGASSELVYNFPEGFVPHTYPQRFVTLFIYLNDVPLPGGETVFPFAITNTTTSSNNTDRGEMTECNAGLAVPANGLHASLFYSQTPEHEIDSWSRHGGCPPRDGYTKWGSNSFMWNVDADEGADAWRTGK